MKSAYNKSLHWQPEPHLSRLVQGLYLMESNSRARHWRQ
jgi:hypothetical protein